MHTPHDGGPAFPQPRDAQGAWSVDYGLGGMTLRDFFAAAYLTTYGMVHEPDYVAAKCYRMADAMLRARAAQPQDEPQSPAEVMRAHLSEFGK